jgi:hypothetical protein
MQAAKKAFKGKRKFRVHLGATWFEFDQHGLIIEAYLTEDGALHSRQAPINFAMLMSDAWEVE